MKHRYTLDREARRRLYRRRDRLFYRAIRKPRFVCKFVLFSALAVFTLVFIGLVLRPHIQAKRYVEEGYAVNEHHQGYVWPNRNTVHIISDPGGRVTRRASYAWWFETQDIDVKVLGTCASACTYHLRNPRTCASPTSLWMFHRGYYPKSMSKIKIFLYDIAIIPFDYRVYPIRFAHWLHMREREMTAEDEIWMVGEDLVTAGWVKACEGYGGDVAEARKIATERSAGFVPSTPLPVR